MKWYDAADDAKRRNAATTDASKHEPFIEGVSFRTDDGTAYGLWRVTVDEVGASTWSVWDCRRGAAHMPRGIRIASGLRTPQHAVMLAEWYARTKVARGAFAALRGVQAAVAMVREEWRL